MHCRAKLLSLEQRRQKQLLNLMFICILRHENIEEYMLAIPELQMFTALLVNDTIITSIRIVLFIRVH